MPLCSPRRWSCGSHAHGRHFFSPNQFDGCCRGSFSLCRSLVPDPPSFCAVRAVLFDPHHFLLSESCLATKPDLRSSITSAFTERFRLAATVSRRSCVRPGDIPATSALCLAAFRPASVRASVAGFRASAASLLPVAESTTAS